MSKDVYTLKFPVGKDVLSSLNEFTTSTNTNGYYRFSLATTQLSNEDDKRLGRDGYINLLDAALSGKIVVNPPKSDRDRFSEIQNKLPLYPNVHEGKQVFVPLDDMQFLCRLVREHLNSD